jgi:transposase
LVLAVVVDNKGWPVSWEVLPGNTADKAALQIVVGKMRQRFQIRRAVVVADRGMISREGIELLAGHERSPYDYILGCRMRMQREVSEEVLARAGRYREVAEGLKVKEVVVGDRRYIVCLNEEEAATDRAAREAILERLQERIDKQGAKSLVGNKGYARFLKMQRGSVQIDQEAVQADARYDGKFVLRTNTDLAADEVAKTYKSLWRVERTFREQKSTLQVRPLFHHRDDTSIGHIVASFLALRLEVDLQRRLEGKAIAVSWPTLMQDLKQVQAVHVALDGRSYLLRTDLRGTATHAFTAAGLRPPSPVTLLD